MKERVVFVNGENKVVKKEKPTKNRAKQIEEIRSEIDKLNSMKFELIQALDGIKREIEENHVLFKAEREKCESLVELNKKLSGTIAEHQIRTARCARVLEIENEITDMLGHELVSMPGVSARIRIVAEQKEAFECSKLEKEGIDFQSDGSCMMTMRAISDEDIN